MATAIHRSFAAGEIAPSLYSRVDLVKYATGLRTCRNFIVQRHGGASNRPGTSFVAEVKDSTKKIGFIPFIFNAQQTYVLEFGDQYMRVHKDGVQVVETPKAITGATRASPAVLTVVGHGFLDGEEVFVNGIVGMVELNNRNFKVRNPTANTFELQHMDTTSIDSRLFTGYVSGGTAARVFEIATPYLEAELPELQFVQSADVVTLVHPNHAPRELARTGDTSWTLTQITFEPEIARPLNGVGGGSVGSNTFRYRVTAVDQDTFEESLPGFGRVATITGATQANPVVITTSAAHFLNTGDEVLIQGVGGMTEINDRRFIVTVTGGSTFELDGEDGTGHTAYSGGGTSTQTHISFVAADPSSTKTHTLDWDAVVNAQEYNVYQSQNGVYGFVGTAAGNQFVNDGINPDISDTPPIARDPFSGAGNFPSTVNYFQQRLMFANTNNNPEAVFASQTGHFKNFTVRSPIQEDDAVTFTLVGRQVNEVRHLVELGSLVVFTEGAEWTIGGDESGILRPTAVNPKQHTYNGSTTLRPLIVGGNALYVQARGGIVRDLGFDFQIDGYRGNDLTIFSSHLFESFSLADWAYQQIPNSVVWAVRSDGVLLGLTYIREHQLWAWHRHDFSGTVENVAVVPLGNEDSLYVLVKRTFGGVVKRYIERLRVRRVDDIVDSVFVDSALTFDGRNTNTSHTMTLTGGTLWTADETLTLTSSLSFFLSTDVGNEIHFTAADGSELRCEITAFTSDTVVSVKPKKTVPSDLRANATSSWARAVDQVTGLHHLEGQQVSALGDGFVASNPNNPNVATKTVSVGSITLDRPFSVIHVGLPIVSDVETLNIDTPSSETLSDKRQLINEVTVHLEESRGIFAGTKPPADDSVDLLNGLREFKSRDSENPDDPPRLLTEVSSVNITSQWNDNGRVFIRQIDPLPLSLLAIAPSGFIPFEGR